jgi:hypothetical protein
MLLPYSQTQGPIPTPYAFKESPNQDRGDATIIQDSGMHFFIAEHEAKIAAMVKIKLPKTRLIPSKDLENGNVVVLLNPAYLHPAGGYPLSEYYLSERLRKSPLTQIDYNCGVKTQETVNPYLK